MGLVYKINIMKKHNIFKFLLVIIVVILSNVLLLTGCNLNNSKNDVKSNHAETEDSDLEKGNAARNMQTTNISGKEYNFKVSEYKNDDSTVLYWNIDIQKDGNTIQTISQSFDRTASSIPQISEIVNIADVNFDGKDDLLILKGCYGVYEETSYNCYLNVDGDYPFQILEDFEKISNPALDSNKKRILQTSKQNGATLTYTEFNIEDNKVLKDLSLKVIDKSNHLSDCTVSKEEENGTKTISVMNDIDFHEVYSKDGYFDIGSDGWKFIGTVKCGIDNCK